MKYTKCKVRVGDWLVQLTDFPCYPNDYKPHCVTKVREEDYFYFDHMNWYFLTCHMHSQFRKATEEEIREVTDEV